MLNIEKYRDRLENYDNSLDCDICKIREKCEDIKNRNCKSCYKCRKENIEWLLSEYQILDDAEKRYLRDVIRPFRKDVKFIKKINNFDAQKIIIEVFIFINSDKLIGSLQLPYFDRETMYKGMEAGKEYTIEELGL